jgi:hypothetical protein
MAFILDFYEQEMVQVQQQLQQQPQPEEQPEEQKQPGGHQLWQRNQRRRQPRLFSLFPCPSFKWRFIKLDGENLNTIFHDTRLQRRNNETNYHYALRCFFEAFNFEKLKIRR